MHGIYQAVRIVDTDDPAFYNRVAFNAEKLNEMLFFGPLLHRVS